MQGNRENTAAWGRGVLRQLKNKEALKKIIIKKKTQAVCSWQGTPTKHNKEQA